MSFQPVLFQSGYLGYLTLKPTVEVQKAAFNQSGLTARQVDYFRENIANATSANELVSDRNLLEVALTAFGLEDDINNRYFIERILAEGVEDEESLANKFADKRYANLAAAFGFGATEEPHTQSVEKMEEVLANFQTYRFETAVGDQDNSMRLALYAEREIAAIASSDISESAKWYGILGTEALRSVVETAFGMPDGFSQLDLDRQLEMLDSRSQNMLGISDVGELSDPDVMEHLLRLYLVRDQANQIGYSSSGAVVLALLTGSSWQ